MSAVSAPDRQIYTADDLERLSAQGHRYELIRGELQAMAPAGIVHGNVTERLAAYVSVYVFENNLGECYAAETGFWVEQDPDTVVASDWAFIAKNRLPEVIAVGFGRVVPDAVIETRSPGDTVREVAAKVKRWGDAGVRLVWEIDPKHQIVTVYRAGMAPIALETKDVLSGEDVIAGFTFPLQRLFRDVKA